MINSLLIFRGHRLKKLTVRTKTKMALASGHWIEKETVGVPPSPRYGHAMTVAGNIAFLFGGASSAIADDPPTYLNDFYMITVSLNQVTWELMPQRGDVPSGREGHTLCVVKGKLYLFGGSSHPEAKECLPGIYCFDIVTLTWEKLLSGGVSLRTLRHSAAALGENIYVYGGILDGLPTDDLMMFNTVSLNWMPIKTTGTLPSERYNHSCAAVGEQIFVFGGCSEDGSQLKDMYSLNTETLLWEQCRVKGESPGVCGGYTFTAHHDKDIYLFGGTVPNPDGVVSSTSEIHKLSIAKMKWKVPLYVGIPPSRRHGHTAFIVHSHLYMFGGRDEEQVFNDLKIMKLINPSERQPVMKEILSEFGLQGVSNSFAATKIPNVKYELSQSPVTVKSCRSLNIQVSDHRDFSAVRDEAMNMIHKAFAMLDEEFQKLDREKEALARDTEALQLERDAHRELLLRQKQELHDMLERHKAQNEAWLRARAEENDKERKELCKLREEVLQEQERLKEEQSNIQKRSEQLLSIMQQFKGM